MQRLPYRTRHRTHPPAPRRRCTAASLVLRLRQRNQYRRCVPGHREHHFARDWRLNGARVHQFVVHRSDVDDRTLRPAVDHAERERITTKCGKPAQPADSFATRISSCRRLCRPTPAASVWSPTCRITIHYASIGTPVRRVTFIRCGRCRARSAVWMMEPARVL